MIAVQVARIIANFVIFCDTADESVLDPDAAVETMEQLASDLEALDKVFLRELIDAFAIIAADYRGETQELVRDIPHGFYLEEALAEGDSVKLAELEALREARG